MKGAIAELLARTNRTPTRTSVMTIGASQYFLFSRMNCHNSLTTCAFDISFPSKHLFVMSWIQLAFGVRAPVRITATRTPMKGIPAHGFLDQSDRSQYSEEYNCEDDASGHKRHPLGERHPRSIRIDKKTRNNNSQEYENQPQRNYHVGCTGELTAIKPPHSEQRECSAHNQAKLSLCSERTSCHPASVMW